MLFSSPGYRKLGSVLATVLPLALRLQLATQEMNCDATIAWATPGEWQAHRATISRLYIHQGKTLAEVMDIMQREYDFHGT